MFDQLFAYISSPNTIESRHGRKMEEPRSAEPGEHREAIQAVTGLLWERREAAEVGISLIPTVPAHGEPEPFRAQAAPRLRGRSPMPIPLTRLIGREAAVTATIQALAESRLVTL